MAERQKLVVPQKYKDKYGDKISLWSYSKVSGIHNCMWEYYLGRIKKEKGEDNIYSLLGTSSHDILEALYNDNIKYEDMADRFESEFLDVELSDFHFTSDEERNEKMSADYKKDISNFFSTHEKIPHKVLTEKLVWIDVRSNIFLGYVDAIFKDDNSCYHIIDWKTSTIFKPSDLHEKQKQLLLYALSLNQLGIPLDKLKIAWNFLKYSNIEFAHMINVTYNVKDKSKTSCCKKEEWVSKVKPQLRAYIKDLIPDITSKDLKLLADACVEENSLDNLPDEIRDVVKSKFELSNVVRTARRSKWVKEASIQTQLRKDLKNNDVLDIEIEMLLIDCADKNSLEPVKDLIDINNYKLHDCYVYGEVSEETINNLQDELCKDIVTIKLNGAEESKWEIDGITEEMQFYCNTLCGYKKKCKYYKKYIQEKSLYTGVKADMTDEDLMKELDNL